MEEATQNMGDYKLKSASDYVVGDEQRVSTDKKRKQLLLMRNMVSSLLHMILICNACIYCRYLKRKDSLMLNWLH